MSSNYVPLSGGFMDSTSAIEQATAQDLPSVLQLYRENEDEDVLNLPSALAIWQRFRVYPNYKLYVARTDGEIVGTFALLIMDNLAHGGAKSGVIEDVIVARKWQRRGVGRRILRFALDRCSEAGCYKLALSSNLKRAEAHAFYEALGFVRHGYSFVASLDPKEQRPST